VAGNALTKPRCQTLDKIEQIADWLGARIPERVVREKCKETWGYGYRNIAYLLSRARALLQERSGKPRHEHQQEAYNFFLSTLLATSDPIVRIRCQEGINRLLGLDAQYTGGTIPPPPSTTVNVTINVTGLSSDQIEELVERGEPLDPKSIEHLPRADRLRILRKAAQVMGPKE